MEYTEAFGVRKAWVEVLAPRHHFLLGKEMAAWYKCGDQMTSICFAFVGCD